MKATQTLQETAEVGGQNVRLLSNWPALVTAYNRGEVIQEYWDKALIQFSGSKVYLTNKQVINCLIIIVTSARINSFNMSYKILIDFCRAETRCYKNCPLKFQFEKTRIYVFTCKKLKIYAVFNPIISNQSKFEQDNEHQKVCFKNCHYPLIKL